jgi:hypothetical protein
LGRSGSQGCDRYRNSRQRAAHRLRFHITSHYSDGFSGFSKSEDAPARYDFSLEKTSNPATPIREDRTNSFIRSSIRLQAIPEV